MRFFALVALSVTLACFAAPPGLAQEDAAPAENVTSQMADALQNAAESGMRVIVIEPSSPDAAAEPAEQAPEDPARTMSSLMEAQTRVDAFREQLNKKLAALPASVNEVLYILRASSPDGRIFTFVEVMLYALGLLAIGALAEREIYGKRLAKGFVQPRIMAAPEGYSEKMPFLVFRFFMGVLGVLFSMLVAYALGVAIFGASEDTAIEYTYVVVNVGYFSCRLVALVWRMILAPFVPQYRIPFMSDHDALKLHRWLWSVASVDIFILLFVAWVAELGLNYDVYALLYSLLSLVTVTLYLSLIAANRGIVTTAILGGRAAEDVSFLARLASQTWVPLLTFYLLFAWVKLTFDLVLERPTSMPLIAGIYMVTTSIIVVYALINYVIERYFRRARAVREMNAAAAAAVEAGAEVEDTEIDVPRIEPPVQSFEDLARRVSGILALVAGMFALVWVWGIPDQLPADNAFDRAGDLIVILFIGYVVYHVFRIWIDDKIREEQGDETEAELGDEGGAGGASRLATLLPLFRNFILIVIVVSVLLAALMEMGVNVSPLFAGAGVVGIAIGFGAQTLVRDIFSGAFFLFDDAFRKGEYIDVGGVKGTVEKISVRSFQLRHHLGPLHTIPFGEIQFLTNYSRDWVIMKLPLRVTYDTDVEKVRKLIKNLGIALLDDPVIGANFIQPLKSQGVVEMQDSAMIIRVKFMTKPGDQWLVRKRVFQEIRELFEREGIKFAHREVTVRLADGDQDDLDEKQRKAITAAAQAAIDEDGLLDDGDGGDDR